MKSQEKTENDFLHELCNAMTIAQGSLHVLINKLQTKPNEMVMTDVIVKVEKSLETVDKMHVLIKERREYLKKLEQE